MGVRSHSQSLRADLELSGQASNGFNSSDDENEVDLTPFHIDWLDLTDYGFSESLGISGLPGCRFQNTWRCVDTDTKTIKNEGVEDIFVLCTKGMLKKYRVSRLFEVYSDAGLSMHHYPFQDGASPSIQSCVKMMDELYVNMTKGIKTLIHCSSGVGWSCVIATCLLLIVDCEMKSEEAIDSLQQLKGPGAIQTMKQFNFVNEFRKLKEEFDNRCDAEQTVSR